MQQINQGAEETHRNVQQANSKLDNAITSARNARRWKWYALIIVSTWQPSPPLPLPSECSELTQYSPHHRHRRRCCRRSHTSQQEISEALPLITPSFSRVRPSHIPVPFPFPPRFYTTLSHVNFFSFCFRVKAMLDPLFPMSRFSRIVYSVPDPSVMMILLAVLCLHAPSRMDVYTRLFDFLVSDSLLSAIADARAFNLCNTSNN